jgi:ubiquinone/menaquinone biosynthesis C-methylase UbiE
MNQIDKSTTMSDGALFHDNLAEGWSAAYESGGFRRRIEFFNSHLKELVKPGDWWLDAGCGSGILARELSLLGARVIAVDGSPKMIECAHRETGERSGSITYKHAWTIETLEDPAGRYNGVLCSSVVEYLENPEKTLSEFFRVLQPGGYLVISVPNRWSLVRLIQKILRLIANCFQKDYFPYLKVSRNEFSSLKIAANLSKFGFFVDRIDNFEPVLSPFIGKLSLGALWVVIARKP